MKKAKKAEPRSQNVTPYLLYKDVAKALDFHRKAFGFVEEGHRFEGEDGVVSHAAMRISKTGDVFMMGYPGPKYKNPKKLGTATTLMYITVNNVDKHFARAKKAGAKIGKLEDTFYGDRRYRAIDPEGHEWFFAQHVRDVSDEEMEEALKKRGE
jgi:PhnB protein